MQTQTSTLQRPERIRFSRLADNYALNVLEGAHAVLSFQCMLLFVANDAGGFEFSLVCTPVCLQLQARCWTMHASSLAADDIQAPDAQDAILVLNLSFENPVTSGRLAISAQSRCARSWSSRYLQEPEEPAAKIAQYGAVAALCMCFSFAGTAAAQTTSHSDALAHGTVQEGPVAHAWNFILLLAPAGSRQLCQHGAKHTMAIASTVLTSTGGPGMYDQTQLPVTHHMRP